MNEVIYHIFGNTVVVHFAGKTHTISKDDKRYSVIRGLIDQNALGSMGLVLDPDSQYHRVKERIFAALGVTT